MSRSGNEPTILKLLVVIFAMIAGGLGWYVWHGREMQTALPANLTPEQVESLIAQYLKDHPDTVIQAVKDAQAQEEQSKAEQAKATLADLTARIFKNPADPVFGNPGGDVAMVEFFDYKCPYCKRVTPDVDALIAEDSNLRVVLKEYPILGPDSVLAAKMAYAAQRQGKYREMHVVLMNHRGDFSEPTLMQRAGSEGVNIARLKNDLADPAIAGQIQANLELGSAIGITGTPAFIVGTKVVPGAISKDDMKKLVSDARAQGTVAQ